MKLWQRVVRCKSSLPLAEIDLTPCGYLKTEIVQGKSGVSVLLRAVLEYFGVFTGLAN